MQSLATEQLTRTDANADPSASLRSAQDDTFLGGSSPVFEGSSPVTEGSSGMRVAAGTIHKSWQRQSLESCCKDSRLRVVEKDDRPHSVVDSL